MSNIGVNPSKFNPLTPVDSTKVISTPKKIVEAQAQPKQAQQAKDTVIKINVKEGNIEATFNLIGLDEKIYPKTSKVAMILADNNNKPIRDELGRETAVIIDKKGNPITDEYGQVYFEDSKSIKHLDDRSTNRFGYQILGELTKGIVSSGATKALAKGSLKLASRLSVAAPGIGVAVGTGLIAYDTKTAMRKQNLPDVSTASKALAWTTVGLDAVATACSGVGAVTAAGVVTAPITAVTSGIGFAAGVLSVPTSVLSDILE